MKRVCHYQACQFQAPLISNNLLFTGVVFSGRDLHGGGFFSYYLFFLTRMNFYREEWSKPARDFFVS